MAVEVVNGVLKVGDRIAYPGPKRQLTGTVHEITETRRLHWNGLGCGCDEVIAEVRVKVREVTPRRAGSEPTRILRNPLNIVILRLANDGGEA